MFQLTQDEAEFLRSQNATSSSHGGRRTLPYAFTEHGVAMLSSVLNSERAVQMNILVIRAFIKLREALATNRELAQRVERLTNTVKDHAALFEVEIQDINKMDRKLNHELRRLTSPRSKKARIGFLS
jgi:phage regulator Rha-like protein